MSDQPTKSSHAEREEKILSFWREKGIFEKSVAKSAPKGDFTFYDGPPFATGTPHYGHILAGTIKDVIPRFKTMQGYRVRRRWGWDCHGLPVENMVEKELGLKAKKDIIDYGIGAFNQKSREIVMRYADEWRRIVPRLGRWVDMEDDYRTMDASYTESVWWIFKQLHDKGLIYEGFKSMNLCPHCGTTLSNFEVAQGYKDVTDISVYVKFKIQDSGFKNQEGDTFVLAWTTTPWTLPGNSALAVNPDVEYVKVCSASTSEGSNSSKEQTISDTDFNQNNKKQEFYILAKSRLASLHGHKFEIIETFSGDKLVGLTYEPLFDYYAKNSSLKNRENGWKIYGADFVTTEDGTGIVHIAPAFGADDYDLSVKYSLPFIQHVAVDGTFKDDFSKRVDGVSFVGLAVKQKDTEEDKNAHQKTDVEIIKWLAHNGLLFEKEKIIHTYPHCWRCETPLLNYATSSWFVKVTDIKDKLVAENKKITWVPPEVGRARFGNWLEGARDWAISRSRFWGAPIPVWREEKEIYHVMGSVEDLKKYSRARNTYWVIRHGEADNNILEILSGDANKQHHLTEKGREQVKRAAEALKGQTFDYVFVSPFVRTQETSEILRQALGLDSQIFHTDDRLRELGSGSWDGRKMVDFLKEFSNKDRFLFGPEGGETYTEIKKRMGDFIYDLEKRYEDKKILIITHETPASLLMAAAQGMDREKSIAFRGNGDFLGNAEIRKLDFHPLPHNHEYELDLHRPFIDHLALTTPEGNKLARVPDVFDCWFESGSMPYGENHYPFNKKEKGMAESFEPKSGIFHKSRGYPADFIAEGLDQTRGWFYSMLVLGVALFGKSPYKKVIVNGLVLAEDGQKMSKSKQNFPDPMLVVDRYGADSLRYYMLSSPAVHGQDLRFSEKGVDEVTKKLVNRLLNVVSFYEMYSFVTPAKLVPGSEQGPKVKIKSQNILDQWIVARLDETIIAVTNGLEIGELDRAARPIMDLVDDLSTWYLRRSRDRFKGGIDEEKQSTLNTMQFVLLQMSKLMAPFMPFLAEEIYKKISNDQTESVHLESWPVAGNVDHGLLEAMKVTRNLASKGLEARMVAKLNVRQPLSMLRVKSGQLSMTNDQVKAQLVKLIKDEVNVKEVVFGTPIENDVQLDTTITPELKEEGMVRELMRVIQDLRKEKGLGVNDRATLTIETTSEGQAFTEKNRGQLMKTCSLNDLKFGSVNGEGIEVGGILFKVSL